MLICLGLLVLHCALAVSFPLPRQQGAFSDPGLLEPHIRSLDGWKHHAALHSMSGEDTEKVVPVCLHADGAEMYRNDEFFVWSWSSAFSGLVKDDLVTRYPICMAPEREMLDEDAPCLMTKVFQRWY